MKSYKVVSAIAHELWLKCILFMEYQFSINTLHYKIINIMHWVLLWFGYVCMCICVSVYICVCLCVFPIFVLQFDSMILINTIAIMWWESIYLLCFNGCPPNSVLWYDNFFYFFKKYLHENTLWLNTLYTDPFFFLSIPSNRTVLQTQFYYILSAS